MIADVIIVDRMYHIFDSNGKELSAVFIKASGGLVGRSAKYLLFMKKRVYFLCDESAQVLASCTMNEAGEYKEFRGDNLVFEKDGLIFIRNANFDIISQSKK